MGSDSELICAISSKLSTSEDQNFIMKHRSDENYHHGYVVKSFDSAAIDPLVERIPVDNTSMTPNKKYILRCNQYNVETLHTYPSLDNDENAFREQNNLFFGDALCNQPSTPTSKSVNDNIVEKDDRFDANTTDVSSKLRQSPSPLRPCNFHIEVDEDGFTQIEVLSRPSTGGGGILGSPYPSGLSSSPSKGRIEFSHLNGYEHDSTQVEVLTQSSSDEYGCWNDACLSRPELSPSPQKCNIINSLLERNRYMCSGLESWYSNDESIQDIIVRDEPEMPRNRSCFPEGRKKRIENLKMNLSPFELDEAAIVKGSINSKKFNPITFEKRNNSFSGFNTPSPTSVAAPTLPSNRFDRFDCYELPTCGNPEINKLALVDCEDFDEEDLCYDSDPNELLVSSTMMQAKKDGKSRKQEIRNEIKSKTVSQLMGTRILLVWHRPFEPSPVAVHTWIEHGSYIHAGLIQPKLMWQESCGKERKDDERFILNKMSFHSIDLLDISKVVPLIYVDRELYPFAKKSKCLLIQAYDKEMIFEAESTAERDSFIEGLKILVARLGSKIIVGDKDVLEEFFTPTSSAVPGQVPDILMDGAVDVTS